jgi:two-component system sensor histidine kinase AgrC
MNVVFPILTVQINDSRIFIVQLLLTINIVIGFIYSKYNSKLILELETENRKSAIALAERYVEAENVTKRYDEIVKFKHYCTKLYRSIVGYIDGNDMRGLKKFYIKNIAPINDQLNKEIGEYQQINHIKIDVIKARMIELINSVSQLPNVNLYIQVNNIIDHVAMKDMDLFAALNIYIDNAVEETMTQEK